MVKGYFGCRHEHSLNARGIKTKSIESVRINHIQSKNTIDRIDYYDQMGGKYEDLIDDYMNEYEVNTFDELTLDQSDTILRNLESLQHKLSSNGIKDIFTKVGYQKYIKEDNLWITELAPLVKQYNAKVSIVDNVVVYENYIPLFRPIGDDNMSFFKEATPNTIYIWNWQDLPTDKFEMVSSKVKKHIGNKNVELIYDPGAA